MEEKKLFEQLEKLPTEQRNPQSNDIDAQSIPEILALINNEDKKVALVVENQIAYITQAVELVVNSLSNGGRLIYIGAGTSGRLGVIDSSECPPTFGVSDEMVQGIIAGGNGAMFKAVEGAEDSTELGIKDIEYKEITTNDVVCGIAASLRTPYVIAGTKRAKELGAKTIYITTNPRSQFVSEEFKDLNSSVDVAICADVGPEVLMGSTRMKSGTAQKLILNMITTTAMIRLGKVYENLMIDLQMTNKKLGERAKRIIMITTGVSYEQAEKCLAQANGHVKTALVMIKAKVDYQEAAARLKSASGFVRAAIEGKKYTL